MMISGTLDDGWASLQERNGLRLGAFSCLPAPLIRSCICSMMKPRLPWRKEPKETLDTGNFRPRYCR